jgi:hypothetical protein
MVPSNTAMPIAFHALAIFALRATLLPAGRNLSFSIPR